MEILNKVIRNKKGISILIVIVIVILVAFTVLTVLPQAVRQRHLVRTKARSMRAFYAAESGISRAMQDLKSGDLIGNGWTQTGTYTYGLSQDLIDSNNNHIARYDVTIVEGVDPDTGEPTGVWEATSNGYSPTVSGIKRIIVASLTGSFVFSAKGNVEISGNAEVNGEIDEFADFDFETFFGKTIEEVKAENGTEVIIDPAENYTPVPSPAEDYTDSNSNGQYDEDEPFDDADGDGVWDDEKEITWFGLEDNSKVKITGGGGWTGSGVMIVEGGDLEITGGTFNGLIWVMGNLSIAGNAVLTGAFFVDGEVTDITTITGTPTITFDDTELQETFGYNPIPFEKLSWREEGI